MEPIFMEKNMSQALIQSNAMGYGFATGNVSSLTFVQTASGAGGFTNPTVKNNLLVCIVVAGSNAYSAIAGPTIAAPITGTPGFA